MSYPATREPTAVVRTSVLLETGGGGPHPHERVPITCLLGDALNTAGTDLSEFPDLEPFEVVVLHPGRTLFEKLDHIHSVARALDHDASRVPNRRIGRHFYDVFQLLGDRRVFDLLADRDQVEAILASIGEIARTHFGGSDENAVRPDGGFAASPAFDLDSDVSLRLRAAYDTTMPELYFGTDPLPTWEAICTRVSELRDLL